MASPIARHVLIVGWDGVRADTLANCATPHLDRLAGQGFRLTMPVDRRNPTISGPVWSTVATGVYSDRHGVTGNDAPGRPSDLPDVLAEVRRSVPGATTFAAAAWAPLLAEAGCGPVFVGGQQYLAELPGRRWDEPTSLAGHDLLDAGVAAATAVELRDHDHAAVFSYFDLPDEVAHALGVGPAYRAAIESCDARLGVLLAAIAARPQRSREEWTVIVITDHGHLDAGGHGGDDPVERTAWLVACGPGIAGAVERVDHADVLPHVLATLGARPTVIDLPGRPFAGVVSPA